LNFLTIYASPTKVGYLFANLYGLRSVIQQLKYTWVLICLFGLTTTIDAQVFEPTIPTSRGDSSVIKSDTTANKPKSKVLPRTTSISDFLEFNAALESDKWFSNAVKRKTKNPKDTLIYPCNEIDTAQIRVNQYRSQGRYGLGFLQQFNLGEPGSPVYTGFEINTLQDIVNPGCNPFGSQIQRARDMDFYRAFAPFAEFNYLQGPGKTIALNALHTQNFSPGWNVTLDYRSIINQDQYIGSGQNNQFRNIKLGSLYQSTNNRYKQIIALTWNRSSRNENGGLAVDSLFFVPQSTEKWGMRTLGFYNPTLTTAASKFKQFEHLFSHKYYLNKHWALSQEVAFQRLTYEYKDSKRDTNYYGSNYFDSKTKTADSNVWHIVTHKTGIEYYFPRMRQYRFSSLSLHYVVQSQTYQSKQSQFNDNFTDPTASHSVEFVSKGYGKFIPRINTIHTLAGYGKGSNRTTVGMPIFSKIYPYKTRPIEPSNDTSNGNCIACEIVGPGNSKLSWGLVLYYNNQFQPTSLQQQAFYSNHFLYNKELLFTGDKSNQAFFYLTKFKKPTVAKLKTPNPATSHTASPLADAQKVKFNSSFTIQNGTWINPTMSIDSVPITQLNDAQYMSFILGFNWYFTKFSINQFISNKTFKPSQSTNLFNYGVPVWKSTTSLRYRTPAFHHAMDLTLGADIQYTSKFQTTYYRPDAATFVVDANKTESGNYFELDLYAAARVQTVDVFLKAEHINEIFTIPGFNTRYQYIAGYPIQPYRIRFGLNWTFYN
jgi:Putative porin